MTCHMSQVGYRHDEMNQIKHYGQTLGGAVTPFDEAVEEALNKRQAARGKRMPKRCTLLRPVVAA